MARAIGTLGTIDTISIGGRTLTQLDSVIVLNGAVNVNNSTGAIGTSSTGYQVPVGFTLKVKCIQFNCNLSGNFVIGYCDNDVGFNSATVPINAVLVAGGAPFLAGIPVTSSEAIVEFDIPAGKYLLVNTSTGAAGFSVFGILE